MKKNLFFLAAMTFASAVFGAANDTVVSFSTSGIDRYSDGSRVRTGESYALVWTANGATFGGLTASCETISDTDKLVMVAPLARRGRCPVTVVEIDANDAKQYENGTFSLYLLDTRRKGADGKITLSDYKNGLPQSVNAFGLSDAKGKDFVAKDGVDGSMNGTAPVCLGEVGVFTEIESPRISAIKLEGAKIEIKVEGLSERADYFVVPGDTPGKFSKAMDVQLNRADGVFKFDKPKHDAPTFYKIIGVRIGEEK